SRQRYELDLVRELASKDLGLRRVAVTARAPLGLGGLVDECIEFDPDGRAQVPDDLRPPVDVVAGQMLGLFKALDLGISPDEPSARGAINRVVQGVTIYPADVDELQCS
ncbi:MAG: sugar isomerase, partial [Bacillota bacterium]|nr:sugar isomerase [Bacillota bacterium]